MMPGIMMAFFAKVFLIAMDAISSVDNNPIFPSEPKLIILFATEKLVIIDPGYKTLTEVDVPESSSRRPREKEDIKAFEAG